MTGNIRGLRWLACCPMLFLWGCGGGGGTLTPSIHVSFTPATVSISVMETDSAAFSVQATVSGDITGNVYAVIVDKVGVIKPNPTITQQSTNTYLGNFETLSSLAVGSHAGNIELHLCKDAQCAVEYSGSPALLPYVIEVISQTNLTPLSPLQGAGDWKMFQRDPAHTGYVAVTLDANKFTSRWLWHAPNIGNNPPLLQPVVTADNSVYVAASGYFSPASLYALNESDHSLRWQHDFGSVFALDPPAVSDGHVFAATSGQNDTAMWSFDGATGTQQFRTPFASQWEHYYAPVVDAGAVFTDGGYYGGAYAFDASAGTQKWFAQLNQYDEWTPAVDGTYVYAYLGESCSGCNNAGLNVIDKASGSVAFRINDPQFNWTGWSIFGAPAIGSNGSVLMVSGSNSPGQHLISFNISSRLINWSVDGLFPSNPALAHGTVYVANTAPVQLEARRETDGMVLWSWAPAGTGEQSFYSDVLVTDNLAFVSTNKAVYAIDLNSHRPVWSYPRPGKLAMSSNGVLYVMRANTPSNNSLQSDGSLAAINLR